MRKSCKYVIKTGIKNGHTSFRKLDIQLQQCAHTKKNKTLLQNTKGLLRLVLVYESTSTCPGCMEQMNLLLELSVS